MLQLIMSKRSNSTSPISSRFRNMWLVVGILCCVMFFQVFLMSGWEDDTYSKSIPKELFDKTLRTVLESPIRRKVESKKTLIPLQYFGERASATEGNVLVLGSGGPLGRTLVRLLQEEGLHVIQVTSRHHLDLRQVDALASFEEVPIAFAFVLVHDHGSHQLAYNENPVLDTFASNARMYQNIFHFLKKRQVPFIFAGSQPNKFNVPFDQSKSLAEESIKLLTPQLGKIVRFWSLYGLETHLTRSHVISDWVSSCLHQRTIHSLTDGFEARRFMHVYDAAHILLAMQREYSAMPFVTEVAGPQWIDLHQVANVISSAAPYSCPAVYGTALSRDLVRRNPHLETMHRLNVNLHDLPWGIRALIRQHQALVIDRQSAVRMKRPYVTVVWPWVKTGCLKMLQREIFVLADAVFKRQLPLQLTIVLGAGLDVLAFIKSLQWPESMRDYISIISAPKVSEFAASDVGLRSSIAQFILVGSPFAPPDDSFYDLVASRSLSENTVYVAPGTRDHNHAAATFPSVESCSSRQVVVENACKQGLTQEHLCWRNTDVFLLASRTLWRDARGFGAAAEENWTRENSATAGLVGMFRLLAATSAKKGAPKKNAIVVVVTLESPLVVRRAIVEPNIDHVVVQSKNVCKAMQGHHDLQWAFGSDPKLQSVYDPYDIQKQQKHPEVKTIAQVWSSIHKIHGDEDHQEPAAQDDNDADCRIHDLEQ